MLRKTRAIARPPMFAVIAMVFALSSGAAAHDIPSDVTVQAFVKPAGDRLHLLVRVPLQAMRDVDVPKRGPGFVDLARVDAALHDAATLWISDSVEIYEDDTPLKDPTIVTARVSLQSDKSYSSYDDAVSHVTGPRLPSDTNLYWEQGMLDVLFEYEIHSDQSDFSIHPAVAPLGLRVVTVLRFLTPSGIVRAFEFSGDPGLVRLDPRWHQAALRFVKDGFTHILGGTDHLLFLFCLVIPFRRLRSLIAVVTAFTIAHSITLIASAYEFGPDALWFPPLIETLIAVSIVYMALENIAGTRVRRRWMIALGFGLVHGFGFSFALRQTLQLAGSHMLTSLLSFNIGVELGQILVLALLIPVLELLFRFVVAERIGTIILSALVAHTGWHWMIDRGDRLRQFGWPVLSIAGLASAIRWLMLILVLAAVLWIASVLRERKALKNAEGTDARSERDRPAAIRAAKMRTRISVFLAKVRPARGTEHL